MARSSHTRRSANVTTPSLTTLLSPSNTPQRTAAPVSPLNPFLRQQIDAERQYVLSQLDRRQFRPGLPKLLTPGASPRAAARLTINSLANKTSRPGRTQNRFIPVGVSFAIPNRVAICVRRKIRREVLHALSLTRLAGLGGARRRRNAYSGIHC